jgi:thiamine monophosphate synthase
MSEFNIPRLILVTNRATARFSLPDLTVRALSGGVDVVQIREKDLGPQALLQLAADVLDAVGDAGRLMINGSPEVAHKLGIGLHVPEAMRRPATVSTGSIPMRSRAVHTVESAAASDWVTFVIAGHVFPTGSKPGLAPIGLSNLSRIVESAPVPVLAIGGSGTFRDQRRSGSRGGRT